MYVWKRSFQYLCFPSPSYANGGINTRLYSSQLFLTSLMLVYAESIALSCISYSHNVPQNGAHVAVSTRALPVFH